MILTVPVYRPEDNCPSLGGLVCDWIEECLVYGPGDLRGQPVTLNDEHRALIWRMYEVFPAGHPEAGRRRFKRVGLSLRKGVGKTELAAWIAAAELHPSAPVRCVGWDRKGNPIGGGVTDPYIPMVAYTEEQSEELAYGALYVILSEGPLRDDFDIGLGRIMRIGGDGKAEALAAAPNARDGARTSFQIFDESHRMILPSLKKAHQTMLANIPKRRIADAWSLEITTAPEPGGGSVAEDTHEYARAVDEGRVQDSRLFYFHRQASDSHDLTTEEGARAAVIEASGPAASWSDIDGIVELWRDPTTDRAYWERVWTNRLVQSSDRAFDLDRWKELADPVEVPRGELITLGFDGSRYHDATALVATWIKTGYQWPVGVWENSQGRDDWEVPVSEVDAVVSWAFEHWDVWRLYADPPYWETWVSEWAGRFGDKRVVLWWTNRLKAMAYALKAYDTAIKAGELRHAGDPVLTRHLGNAHRRKLQLLDEERNPLWVIQKERSDSPHKIDAAMAAVLSWEARNDAIASGQNGQGSIYNAGASLFL